MRKGVLEKEGKGVSENKGEEREGESDEECNRSEEMFKGVFEATRGKVRTRMRVREVRKSVGKRVTGVSEKKKCVKECSRE